MFGRVSSNSSQNTSGFKENLAKQKEMFSGNYRRRSGSHKNTSTV